MRVTSRGGFDVFGQRERHFEMMGNSHPCAPFLLRSISGERRACYALVVTVFCGRGASPSDVVVEVTTVAAHVNTRLAWAVHSGQLAVFSRRRARSRRENTSTAAAAAPRRRRSAAPAPAPPRPPTQVRTNNPRTAQPETRRPQRRVADATTDPVSELTVCGMARAGGCRPTTCCLHCRVRQEETQEVFQEKEETPVEVGALLVLLGSLCFAPCSKILSFICVT